MSDSPTVLRLLNTAKEEKDAEEARMAASAKRAKGKSDFYSKARINAKLVEELKKALLISAVMDENGDAVMAWTDELIQEIVDNVDDDGPVNKTRDTK